MIGGSDAILPASDPMLWSDLRFANLTLDLVSSRGSSLCTRRKCLCTRCPIMKRPHLMQPMIPGVLGAAAFLSGLLVHFLLPHQIWIHVPLHSTVEALGGLAAVLMGLVLLARKEEWEDERLQGLASGLLGMGILEGFHAVSSPDQGFVLLRSVASLLGGVAFSFVWHPPGMIGTRIRAVMPYLVAGATVAFGMLVI